MGGDSLHCCYREQMAYALYARFREPKLYRYVSSGDWDLIPARCRSHPREASFVHKYAPNDTALHHLLRFQQDSKMSGHCLPCLQQAPPAGADVDENDGATSSTPQEVQLEEKWKLDAVEALIRASPVVAVTRPDAFGKTPLHLACVGVATCSGDQETEATFDERICLALLRAYPRAAALQDSVDKRTPLHYLVARNDNVSILVLRSLVSAAPQSVHVLDATGDSVADIVRSRGNEISNASSVLKILKQAEAATDPVNQSSMRSLQRDEQSTRSITS